MKAFILLIITSLLSLYLVSCEKFSSRWDIPESDEMVVKNRAEEILNALDNNDKEALRSMFCEQVLNETDNFDVRLEYITDFFEGKTTSYEGSINGIFDGWNPGSYYKYIQARYIVKTDINSYYIFFVEQTDRTEDPSQIGLYTLQVMLESDEDTKFASYPPFPGIYMPEDITWYDFKNSPTPPEQFYRLNYTVIKIRNLQAIRLFPGYICQKI
jgi:hypothetical protein